MGGLVSVAVAVAACFAVGCGGGTVCVDITLLCEVWVGVVGDVGNVGNVGGW